MDSHVMRSVRILVKLLNSSFPKELKLLGQVVLYQKYENIEQNKFENIKQNNYKILTDHSYKIQNE